MKTLNIIATATLLSLGLPMSVAMAQDYNGANQSQQNRYERQQQGAYGAAQQQKEFDEATLKKFAKAHTKITKTQIEYSQKIHQTSDQQKAQSLQIEAQDKMLGIIKNNGLTIEDYNAIALQMNTDPELIKKIESFK